MSRSDKLNIVFISIDTLRPDHLGCHGYHRDTSPHLDAFAAEGALFTQAIAPHIPTSPSHTSFYTGLHVLAHKIAAHVPSKTKLDRKFLMLPQILQRKGYTTAAVDNLVTLSHGRASWFARGYDYYAGFNYQPGRDVGGRSQGGVLTDRAVELVELMRDQEFFLFVHYWDPHAPYQPPAKFNRMFYDGDPYDRRHTSMQRVMSLEPEYYRSVLADMRMDGVRDLDYVVAQYDASIRAVDENVGQLLAALDRLELSEETLVVIVSDHGEAFGEGELYFEHHGLHDAVLRIVMMLRLPGRIREGERIRTMVAGYDLAPTILEAVGLSEPFGLPYELSGRSLWPVMDGHTPVVHDALVLSEASRQASYGLRTPGWKLIVPVTTTDQGVPIPDFYGQTRDPHPVLYDLERDPRETRDVAVAEEATLAGLLSRLQDWREEELRRWGGSDPVSMQVNIASFTQSMRKYRDRLDRRGGKKGLNQISGEG